MRMLRIALVLIVLASFAVASVAVSTAAVASPKAPSVPKTAMKVPTMPAAPKMPTKKPGQMINLEQMKSNIGNVYQSLHASVKMPGASVNGANAGVKNKASKMQGNTYGRIAQGMSTPLSLSVPAPQPISQLGGLPKMGSNLVSLGNVPGVNQMVSLGL